MVRALSGSALLLRILELGRRVVIGRLAEQQVLGVALAVSRQ